jgi:hypothetical protein
MGTRSFPRRGPHAWLMHRDVFTHVGSYALNIRVRFPKISEYIRHFFEVALAVVSYQSSFLFRRHARTIEHKFLVFSSHGRPSSGFHI